MTGAPELPASVPSWLGRVFAAGTTGGNHTAIVESLPRPIDPQDVARRLGVPDTGFVVERAKRRVRLRTFSPVEELSQCLQVSLAAVSALGAPLDETWTVRHERGEELEVVREGDLTWARYAANEPTAFEAIEWPAIVRATRIADLPVRVVRQSRSRLLLPCADVTELDRVELDPGMVLETCRQHDAFGIVAFSATGDTTHRVRVFTTSLGGREDSATGGAVLAMGLFLAAHGTTGQLRVTQGPPDPERQGTLWLRIGDRDDVQLGGEVLPLLSGRLCL